MKHFGVWLEGLLWGVCAGLNLYEHWYSWALISSLLALGAFIEFAAKVSASRD